ncbi:MAG: ogr/Delta-like zinc finger family protein [Marinobacterium sp.]|nr:ogr/Delta-like zinc finger family protein [Marinobacterium sp.]
MGSPRNKCPHCGHAMQIRNSNSEHPLMRAMYLQCTNIICGATFRGNLELTHTLSPSASPNPDINLPLADASIRRLAQAKPQPKKTDA